MSGLTDGLNLLSGAGGDQQRGNRGGAETKAAQHNFTPVQRLSFLIQPGLVLTSQGADKNGSVHMGSLGCFKMLSANVVERHNNRSISTTIPSHRWRRSELRSYI